MTHRERVLQALNHAEPDRVPLFYRDMPEVEQRLLNDLGVTDREELLRQGTPDEVAAEVRRLLDVMAPGGGFFVGPTHSFQDDIPTENIVSLYEVAGAWRY